MPVIVVPELVTLSPLRFGDMLPWTPQPDGGPDMLVGDIMYSSSIAAATVSEAQRETVVFKTAEPRLGGTSLRPYQEECVEAVFDAWDSGKKAPLIVLATGCHRAGQKVVMADGSLRRVEDIVVSDRLLGPDGTVRVVQQLCRGSDRMYEIRPHKGPAWVVNGDHVLSLVKTGEGLRDRRLRARGVDLDSPVDVTVNEWLSWGITQKHVHKLYRSTEIEFPDAKAPDLPIDPYFLGVLLGDGSLAHSRVEVSKPDIEIRDECQRQATAHGLRLVMKNCRENPTWALVLPLRGVKKNPLLEKMRGLGLCPLRSEDRFVPQTYMTASAADRRHVLAGLLDTDGHQPPGKSGYEFSSKSRQLADDVVFLARSLGLASVGAVETRNGCQTGAVGTYWRVMIDGDTDRIPLRIPRKMSPPRRQKKNQLRTGFSIVPTGTDEPFYGFVLDGDRRYLLDDFTVTHNSGKTIIASEIVRRTRILNQGFGYRVWFVAHRKKLLDQMYRSVKLVAPEATCGIIQGTRSDIGKFLTIASLDTLASDNRFRQAVTGTNRNVSSLKAMPPSLVIIDEAHRATSPKYKRLVEWILAANPACRFLGMTATPGRTDGIGLDSVFDVVAYEKNAFQLISEGYLVPPTGYRVNLNVNLDVIPTEDGEFKKAPLSKVINQPAVNQAVVEGYQEFGDGRKMLAFCVDVAHAKDLAETFRKNGIQARHVDGSMKDDDVNATLLAFTEGKTRIIASCDMLTEGYDDPSAQGILFARPTKSQLVYIQALGRGLRLYPGKSDCLVLDCVGNSAKHQIVQLASLAGLGEPDKGPGKERDELIEPSQILDAEVGSIEGHKIDFTALRRKASKWSWTETRFGWTVSVPHIGYFLLAWTGSDRQLVDVKLHDMREGKKDSPPVVLSSQIDFEMAFGMVEQELARLFSAGVKRIRHPTESSDPVREMMDDALVGELFSPEDLMRSDAAWRDKPISPKQQAALLEAGVKLKDMPKTSGEASDLFNVMTVEKNAKMRQPATPKQKAWLLRQKLATHDEAEAMTKKQAQALLVKFLREKEAKKKAETMFAEDETPLPLDEDLR